MPPDEQKYFNKIKREKMLQNFRKNIQIQNSSNNLHVMCDK
jgi:hypothetical protein